MEQAFKEFLEIDKNDLKIKLFKLKILGILIDAEYDENGKEGDVDLLSPPLDGLTKERFESFISLINNTDNMNDAANYTRLTDNNRDTAKKLLESIKVINYMVSLFKSSDIKDVKIDFTSQLQTTVDKDGKETIDVTPISISILKAFIEKFEEAYWKFYNLPHSSKRFEDTEKLLAKAGGYSPSLYNNMKRYISYYRRYNECMLYFIHRLFEKTTNSTYNLKDEKDILKSRDSLNELVEVCNSTNSDDKLCFNKLKDQFRKLFEYTKKVEKLYQIALNDIKYNQKIGGRGGGRERGAERGREGVPVKYKTTGEVVYILYNKKRIKRNIYVKVKGRPAKYCKINKEYVLLSKLSRVTPR
jgi:hypothetical protein